MDGRAISVFVYDAEGRLVRSFTGEAARQYLKP
jgi:hypothetical protein